MTSFVVGEEAVGDRLDVVLAAQLGMSRSRAAASIDDGRVTVDGHVVSRGRRLRPGEHVEVAASPPETLPPPPPVPPIRFEDAHLLVVAKPAGLVVHPGSGHPGGTLIDALGGAGIPLAPGGGEGRPGVVHRLDRDTSGLLLVAKTDEAHAALVSALQRRDVSRHYLALVSGAPRAGRGRIEAPIGRDPRDRKRFAVVTGGKPAATRYRVLRSGDVAGVPRDRAVVTLVGCELDTGRTHQIRVHLSGLGNPVIGDRVYGRWPDVAAALGLERPFLHAATLAFSHPVTGQPVTVEEPLPPELASAAGRAGIDVTSVDW